VWRREEEVRPDAGRKSKKSSQQTQGQRSRLQPAAWQLPTDQLPDSTRALRKHVQAIRAQRAAAAAAKGGCDKDFASSEGAEDKKKNVVPYLSGPVDPALAPLRYSPSTTGGAILGGAGMTLAASSFWADREAKLRKQHARQLSMVASLAAAIAFGLSAASTHGGYS
jgi:hypothetical protein